MPPIPTQAARSALGVLWQSAGVLRELRKLERAEML